ncbi:MAG: PHP domain-containing protein [Gammaproteobacteria bacterium]
MASHVDLHTHTLRSDGTLTPTDLVTRAHAHGVKILALTDHDVTDGLVEAGATATALGMQLVPGVEISVTWEGQTLHIVGLAIDPAHAALQQGLAQLREFRNWRAREIDRRLAKKRISGAFDYASNLARGSILSRTHFARFLVDRGYVRTMGDAFKHYLTRGRPGHVPGQWATLAQAVGWICDSGGIAVIAHPARYKLTSGKRKRLLDEFKACGGRAIEVISGSHSAADNQHYAELAVREALLASVGSDYHGPEKPWVELGRLPALPAGCTPVWESLALAQ